MERKTCEGCGGKIEKKKIEFTIYGELLGLFPAEICTKCGEELFDEEVSEEIDRVAKEKGIWGLEASTKVAKVGSSYAIIINKRIADFLELKQGENVHIHPENRKKIVINI